MKNVYEKEILVLNEEHKNNLSKCDEDQKSFLNNEKTNNNMLKKDFNEKLDKEKIELKKEHKNALNELEKSENIKLDQ